MMDETLTHVKTFHDAFGVDTPAAPGVPGLEVPGVVNTLSRYADTMRFLGEDLMEESASHAQSVPLLRLQLIQEELGELAEALATGDIVGALDALCDLRYVVDGTVHALGLSKAFMPAFREVQRSNMSKLEDGKPVKNEAGRVVKGRDYSPPKLAQFIENL